MDRGVHASPLEQGALEASMPSLLLGDMCEAHLQYHASALALEASNPWNDHVAEPFAIPQSNGII